MARKQASGLSRVLVVYLSQYYDSFRDTSTGGGNNDGQELRVIATAATVDAQCRNIRNASDGEDFEHALTGGMLENLRVRCTAQRRDGELSYQHQDVEYYSPLTIRQDKAKGMVKVFAAIERGLERAGEQDGWHENAGQYIARVARSIGATGILLLKKHADTRFGGYDANATQYDYYGLGQAVNVLNSRMRTWANGSDEQQSSISY